MDGSLLIFAPIVVRENDVAVAVVQFKERIARNVALGYIHAFQFYWRK